MDKNQLLELAGRACLIVSDEFTRLSDALRSFNNELIDAAAGAKRAAETMADICDPIVDLRQLLEELCTKGVEDAFAELVEEAEDIPPPRKMPRPPKHTGPVNKANYTANRPPRVARSSCRIIKR